MTIEHLIAFNAALFAALVSPGPAFLLAMRTAVSGGRRSGILLGLGLGLMAATWTLMALFGLEAVFRLFPWAYAISKTIGAIYLLYIAFGMWRGARDELTGPIQPARWAFRQGILINLSNPKSVLFAAAVLAVIFPANMTMVETLTVAINQLAVEFAFYAALAFVMSTRTVTHGYLGVRVYIDRTASAVLAALGLRLLLSR